MGLISLTDSSLTVYSWAHVLNTYFMGLILEVRFKIKCCELCIVHWSRKVRNNRMNKYILKAPQKMTLTINIFQLLLDTDLPQWSVKGAIIHWFFPVKNHANHHWLHSIQHWCLLWPLDVADQYYYDIMYLLSIPSDD